MFYHLIFWMSIIAVLIPNRLFAEQDLENVQWAEPLAQDYVVVHKGPRPESPKQMCLRRFAGHHQAAVGTPHRFDGTLVAYIHAAVWPRGWDRLSESLQNQDQ